MNKLYKMMNWPEIEGVVYSDTDHPHQLLGAHKVGKNIVFQAFFPDAKSVNVLLREEQRILPMEKMDEAGYFAALLSAKSVKGYQYEVTYADENKIIVDDAYSFSPLLRSRDTDKYNAGIYYDVYEKLGAHPMTVDGVSGCEFALWAPNAMRVSVVGDFNHWDGRIHQMQRLGESGIFEIFIPGVKLGDRYKYELKIKSSLTYLKADPFAFQQELPPRTASVVCDINSFTWRDSDWLNKRLVCQKQDKPISIYELHLGSFLTENDEKNGEKNNKPANYEEIADSLISYVKRMGYTHVELLPVMEYPLDNTLGYQTIGYYAPTSRYGNPDEFMRLIDQLHRADIGVILDWTPEHFPKDDYGLRAFDGTCLYEHLNPQKGENPKKNTLLFNYGRNEVGNYLISSALFWVEKYHVDGIRISSLGQMLYLDYDRLDGDWVPNIYGGNENLEAIEWVKQWNFVLHKRNPGVLTIAEDDTAWPGVTDNPKEGGLGFDYKWNNGWLHDYLSYISYDPYFRSYHHDLLTLSMVYAYSEHFILPFPHNEVVCGKQSFLNKMPGNKKEQMEGLRLSLAYMFMHPGKKHIFMGQDIGATEEWCHDKGFSWKLLEQKEHAGIRNLTADLNHFYVSHPALYQADDKEKGFCWVNCIDTKDCKLVFIRSTWRMNQEEQLLVVCNFAGIDQDGLVGVPYPGKYKELFNTDDVRYGGQGHVNVRARKTLLKKADGYEQSIRIKIPARSVCIFKMESE